ncbi:hypothetical protein [Rhodopirellula sp. P2]|uniref:hypothetical protein n=1 Tax=Rhodopirellula sp. P2 TaxID=2127060 RepID=UPI002367D1C5|nr:hypothetical protein [Rhodopirellula sp. P2]WDQ16561.1 hypothetical protein PSR62_23515 [Rhodopirellula sp. P2]
MKRHFLPRLSAWRVALQSTWKPLQRRLCTSGLAVCLGALFGIAPVSAQDTPVAEPPVQTESATPPRPLAETEPATTTPTEPAPVDDAPAAEEPTYVRVHEVDDKPFALQTATVQFVGQPGTQYDGAIVDLVGVVHIGQDEYYADLKEQLSKYDCVLYELVAPDGTRIRPEDLEERRSILASVQTGMKDMLNLEYQLEKIDYMAENFRHADMSPEEFVEDLEKRGDSIWKMVARMLGAGIASQAKTGGDAGLMVAMFSGEDRPMNMKRAMARQLVDIELVTAGMDDANGENTLIKGRNRKAFEILKQELDAGKENIAVFYGAGHLPDMADRLENEFGMQPTQTTWSNAWDLTRN